jgi:hypothetical protein
MDAIVMMNKSDLWDFFHEIQSDKKEVTPSPAIPERLSLVEAQSYLKSKGIHIPKSSMYKNSMANTIPVLRFGRKLVFDRKALDNWVQCQLIEQNSESPILSSIRNSANKKGRRVA